ncbi:ATP-binding protein [Flexithrix dorotheae]|uniref:ATP-binding protein n=1 Tax=Flexithrix dorotheae TaxID=70993 RepID=UPI000382D602|nr:ATP-binding protein [Flexithrix dorotheae]
MKITKKLYLVIACLSIISAKIHAQVKTEVSFSLDKKRVITSANVEKLTREAEDFLERGFSENAIQFAEEALLMNEGPDPSEFNARNLLTIARSYLKKDQTGSALKYFLRASKEYERLSDDKGLSDVYLELAYLYKKWESPNKALEYFLVAESHKEKLGDDLGQINILENTGKIYCEMGSYEKAIVNYSHLMGLYSARKDTTKILRTLEKLANSSNKIQDYNASLNYNLKILNINKTIKDSVGIAHSLHDIGYVYKDLKNYNKSLGAFMDFRIVCKDLDMDNAHFPEYTETLLTIGQIYQYLGDEGGGPTNYKHALNSYDKKLRISQEVEDQEGIARTYNQIALIYIKLDNFTAAIEYANKAQEIAKELENKEILYHSYYYLYNAYTFKKKYKKSLAYHQLYSQIKDSLLLDKLDEQKKLLEKEEAENRKQFIINKREQMIVGQELDTLEVKKLQLQAEKRDQELALLLIDKELKEFELKNEHLKNEKAKQDILLLKRQYQTEKQEKQIALLEKNREIQAYALKQQEMEKQERKAAFAMLEKDKELKELELSKQESINRYTITGIVLITVILCLIFFTYLQTRKANSKLSLKNKQIETQSNYLEEAYKNLELLSEMGQSITASLSIENIIELIYENVNTLMDVSVFGVGIYNPERSTLDFPAIFENGVTQKEVKFKLTEEDNLAVYCFNHQQEVILKDFEREASNYISGGYFTEKAGIHHASSLIYVPLVVQSKSIGVLTVQSFKKNAYSDYHINILRNIALYAKIALENANAYKKIGDQKKTLQIAYQNINEQKRLIENKNKELVELNKEKNHLIGIVAHDLRNPLAIAISLTNFLQHNTGNLKKEQLEGIKITSKSLNRMFDMITKILDLKSIESKKINIQLQRVNVLDVINHVNSTFEEALSKKQIELSFNIQTDDPYSEVDHNYITQIFENLISNAIKFSPFGKKIVIRVYDVRDKLRVSIIDEGPGINKEDRKKLFGKYQKLSAKPTGGEMSTGLGLSIVKKYVELMNGNVWCESNLGAGAEFVVEFNKSKAEVYEF